MLLEIPKLQEDERGNSIELIDPQRNRTAFINNESATNSSSNSISSSSSSIMILKAEKNSRSLKDVHTPHSLYRITMMPGVTLYASLYFKPVMAGSHDFQVPLYLLGLSSTLLFPGEEHSPKNKRRGKEVKIEVVM